MALTNPAFNSRSAFAEETKGTSSLSRTNLAGTLNEARMTYEDTIAKTVGLFAVLLVGAAVGWFIPALALPAALVGFVLALVNSFKKNPSAPLIFSYAAVEGVFVGGLSAILEARYPGVAVQAIIATLITVGVVLALFSSGKIRASKKATKIFFVALIAYAIFSLVNFGLVVTGAISTPFGLNSIDFPGTSIPMGLIIGALAVLLASYSLVLDFDFVQKGVQNGLPAKFGWQAGFGIMVTVVWLYVEFLRLFALSRD